MILSRHTGKFYKLNSDFPPPASRRRLVTARGSSRSNSHGGSSEVGPKEIRKPLVDADDDDRRLGHVAKGVTSLQEGEHEEDQFLSSQFMNSCVKVYATHVEPNYRCQWGFLSPTTMIRFPYGHLFTFRSQ